MPEVQNSCCHVDTPSNAICMKQMKHTSLKYALEKALPQTSAFSHVSHLILRESQRWQLSAQGTSVSYWMAIYLKYYIFNWKYSN